MMLHGPHCGSICLKSQQATALGTIMNLGLSVGPPPPGAPRPIHGRGEAKGRWEATDDQNPRLSHAWFKTCAIRAARPPRRAG
jgi:hypothetical protein